MATKSGRWTRADLKRFPNDGNRYEVLDGELLVTPQANAHHQWIAAELTVVLSAYCKRHALGVVVGPGAVIFRGNELQPDVQVIPCRPEELHRPWARLPRPLLVVEIVSEGSRHHDFVTKRAGYAGRGIPAYWIVDPDDRTVTVVQPGRSDEVTSDVVRWQPAGADASLEIPLAPLFA